MGLFLLAGHVAQGGQYRINLFLRHPSAAHLSYRRRAHHVIGGQQCGRYLRSGYPAEGGAEDRIDQSERAAGQEHRSEDDDPSPVSVTYLNYLCARRCNREGSVKIIGPSSELCHVYPILCSSRPQQR